VLCTATAKSTQAARCMPVSLVQQLKHGKFRCANGSCLVRVSASTLCLPDRAHKICAVTCKRKLVATNNVCYVTPSAGVDGCV
jgi:hypothetical protein